MPNVLVVTGSARPNNVSEKIAPLVITELEARGATPELVKVQELNLPFYNDPLSPTSPDFAPTDPNVQAWTEKVATADGIVFVTPEYNHTMSPIQLNAIDWIGKQWEDKPVGLVGYGWSSGATQAHATARESLAVNLKAKVGDDQTNLFFMKHLNPDGSILDKEAVDAKIAASVSELLETIG